MEMFLCYLFSFTMLSSKQVFESVVYHNPNIRSSSGDRGGSVHLHAHSNNQIIQLMDSNSIHILFSFQICCLCGHCKSL